MTKAATAFFAAFGWIGVIVVLIILIVIIIVAAIAGSPFGIFISDEAAVADSIPVSSIINECNMELSAKLTEIEDGTTHDRIVMEGEQADWSLVLSIFSVKVAGVDDETVQDVVVIDDGKKEKLKEVFWDMHTITTRTETEGGGEDAETVLYITINTKTKYEMILEYDFTNKKKLLKLCLKMLTDSSAPHKALPFLMRRHRRLLTIFLRVCLKKEKVL